MSFRAYNVRIERIGCSQIICNGSVMLQLKTGNFLGGLKNRELTKFMKTESIAIAWLKSFITSLK